MSQTTPMVEVSKIDVEDGFNPRTHMSDEGLERLAASLAKTDVVQPLTVRPVEDGRYVVIAGHRRLRAAKIAGIKQVPVHEGYPGHGDPDHAGGNAHLHVSWKSSEYGCSGLCAPRAWG